MLITDQINLTFEQPLKKTTLFATHHAPLYDIALQNVVKEVAREKKIPIERGVYCGLKGPSYETAAEVSMLQRLGADAIGMSTVNEVILAVALGMRVAGISCITNLGTGIAQHTLSHAEVTEVANRVKGSFAALLDGVIKRISTE